MHQGTVLYYLHIVISHFRATMNALKAAGIIGIKACRAIIYKIPDVIRMHSHWNVPVPQYLHDLNEGKVLSIYYYIMLLYISLVSY